MKDTVITDSFWRGTIRLVREVMLPYQWAALNDEAPGAEKSGCIENFKIAAGLKRGEYYGFVFQDSDLAKWLEAAAYLLGERADAELERRMDAAVALIGKAQWPDGYINTCTTLTDREKRWRNLYERHELYNAGHLMEAAVACCEAAGKRELLDIMRRFADLICDTFGPGEGQIPGYPGHQEVEIGLIRMYRATGEARYLKTAQYFIDARGAGENYFEKEARQPGFPAVWNNGRVEPAYNQSHLPVREQTTAEGHCVRALYMYRAMADLAKETNDGGLRAACETLWENVTQRRMYITGGVGSSAKGERFTADFDLPNDAAYAETCASIALFLFGVSMSRLARDARYIDAAERALYNTVLAGMGADGASFLYVNPLEVVPRNCVSGCSIDHVKPTRQKWFGCACCPPNIARLLASLRHYIYLYEAGTLYVNLLIASEGTFDGLTVEMRTDFPRTGAIELRVDAVGKKTIALRIPAYAEDLRLRVNGAQFPCAVENGYAAVPVEGSATIEAAFDMPAHFVWANPAVAQDNGRVAVQKGPLVYCFEERDNGPGIASFFADTGAPLSEEWDDNLGAWRIGVTGRRADGWQGGLYGTKPPEARDARLVGIPYAFWGNRGEGEMFVWLRER